MGRYHIYEQHPGSWIVKDDRCFSKRQVYRISETSDTERQIFSGDNTYPILTVQIVPQRRVVEVSRGRVNHPIQINWPQTHRGKCDLMIGNEAFHCTRSELTSVRGGWDNPIASWDRKFTSGTKVGYLDVYYVADAAIRRVMDTPMILATFIGVQLCMKYVDTVANQTPPMRIRYKFGGQEVGNYVNAGLEIWRLLRRFYRGP